jgi:hypothetical protein
MTRSSPSTERIQPESGVSTIVEYIIITAILMIALVILMLSMNAVFMEQPRDAVSYHAFVDIGNGVSTRIVDLFVVAPKISAKSKLPAQAGLSEYNVEITPPLASVPGSEKIIVSRGLVKSTSSIAGIGATLGVGGNTTGGGVNVICYDSSGLGVCPP